MADTTVEIFVQTLLSSIQNLKPYYGQTYTLYYNLGSPLPTSLIQIKSYQETHYKRQSPVKTSTGEKIDLLTSTSNLQPWRFSGKWQKLAFTTASEANLHFYSY